MKKKKFYIVFFNSKHGENLYFEDSLELAILKANALTKEHYSDYAKEYKDVETQGCYDSIFIKSIEINESISSSLLTRLFNKINVNRHCLDIEDNELIISEKYPYLKRLTAKYNWELVKTKVNLYSDAIALGKLGEPIYLSTECFKKPSVTLNNNKAYVDIFNEYSKSLGTSIENVNNYHTTLIKLEEWATIIIDKKIEELNITHEEGTVVGIKIY